MNLNLTNKKCDLKINSYNLKLIILQLYLFIERKYHFLFKIFKTLLLFV